MKKGKKHFSSIEEAISLSSFRANDFFFLKSATRQISSKQREAFQKALAQGYYENPRKTSIDELAEKFGSSPSNFAEHLRKTKSKIICIFWNFLEKL